MIMNTRPAKPRRVRTLARLAASAVLLACATVSAASAQQAFKTPDEAASALVAAAKSGDRNALLTVLGRDATDIISSGDAVADKNIRDEFVAAYDEKHAIETQGDHATMVIGNVEFPFPIPLVHKGETWSFDTKAGREEVLYRRIGRNELATIQACLAYVDAHNEYADKDRTGAGPGVYAQRIQSQPGKKDGLYWPTKTGEDASPLGELVADATTQGYRFTGVRAPFHGYYYKVLTRQGPAASGGTLDYVVNGKMIGGFALVAYPAEYGNSGVMTFIVNHNGTVYEKDLGERTAQRAEAMTVFNPDDTWKKVDVSQLE